MREYNDETHIDEILDIIKYKFLNDKSKDHNTMILILWYIYSTKKKQCEYDHLDKKTNKKSIYNSIIDILGDYDINKDKWKEFSTGMDSFQANIGFIKDIEPTKLNNFISMLKNSYKFMIQNMNIKVDNISEGFFYGYIMKTTNVSIKDLISFENVESTNSTICYGVLFLSILRKLDRNEFMDENLYPTIDIKESIEVEVKEEPEVKEEIAEEKNISEDANGKKEYDRAANFKTDKRYEEVDYSEIKLLDPNKKYKSAKQKITGKSIDLVDIYNKILTGETSVKQLQTKYNVVGQSIRNHINSFCVANNLPRPRANAYRINKANNEENDPFSLNNDPLYKKAQIMNSQDINRISNSKIFFPSKIKGLKEEITGQKPTRRFINKPITRCGNVNLILTDSQKDIILNKGEQWLTLNDGRPYFITKDMRIWRNKPSAEDLEKY